MAHRPLTRRTAGSAGSQALAVLSCALALLAVDPVGLKAAQETPAPLTRMQGSVPTPAPILVERTPTEMAIPPAPTRPENRRVRPASKTGNSPHATLLQTVALLNAVLIQHLAPLAPQAVLTPGAIAARPLPCCLPRPTSSAHPAPLPQPYQQAFALAHCLLAPPV